MSQYIFNLKEEEVYYIITEEELRKSDTCHGHSLLCSLCLKEKRELLLCDAMYCTPLSSGKKCQLAAK